MNISEMLRRRYKRLYAIYDDKDVLEIFETLEEAEQRLTKYPEGVCFVDVLDDGPETATLIMAYKMTKYEGKE